MSITRKIEEIKQAIGKFSFIEEPALEHPHDVCPAHDLESRYGCGRLAAELIATVMPVHGGQYFVGSTHVLSYSGYVTVLQGYTEWAGVFIHQGYAPLLYDSYGNPILIPVHDEVNDSVILIGHDTVGEEDWDIQNIGSFYKGNLLALLEAVLVYPGRSVFEDACDIQ